MKQELDNAQIDLERAASAIKGGNAEYGIGLVNDAIDELNDLKKRMGY